MDLPVILVLLFISLFSSIIANSATESGTPSPRVFCVTSVRDVYFKEVDSLRYSCLAWPCLLWYSVIELLVC